MTEDTAMELLKKPPRSCNSGIVTDRSRKATISTSWCVLEDYHCYRDKISRII